ncbi:unnamed protein product [Clonostachys rosea f. rosea IK726]|uniref:Uncharacterized protein n=1 Tax=Clonostachys rosea f. rosea IK726 TaxID=1349383 RepID=A0ACA9ULY2_BIOOC|nr:unnamed protein product [Clonostachys rosea f. rosea IK726]
MVSINIPNGQTAVKVKVIDNGARITGPMAFFLDPPILVEAQRREKMHAPAFSFLVEHETLQRKVVFDLGIRANPEQYPPAVLKYHEAFSLVAGREVYDVLKDGGVDLNTIEAIIWSHHHMDHTGNPNGFPSTTDLIVGPGFKETLLPSYPENPKAMIGQRDYEGRNLRQLDFKEESKGLTIGGFPAIDYFEDGSFYLLQAPGHSIDHMAGLARTSTSPARFILMGADIGHHASQWRPSEHRPIPKELTPSPFGPESRFNLRLNVCPGELFTEHVHPQGRNDVPFTRVKAGHPYDAEQAQRDVEKMVSFDEDDRIMVIAAHDFTLLPMLDYFPKEANGWHDAGWKESSRWDFLKGLACLVPETAART